MHCYWYISNNKSKENLGKNPSLNTILFPFIKDWLGTKIGAVETVKVALQKQISNPSNIYI